MPWHLRPVASQHTLAEGIDFHLSDDGHAGSFEAEIQAADASKQ